MARQVDSLVAPATPTAARWWERTRFGSPGAKRMCEFSRRA